MATEGRSLDVACAELVAASRHVGLPPLASLAAVDRVERTAMHHRRVLGLSSLERPANVCRPSDARRGGEMSNVVAHMLSVWFSPHVLSHASSLILHNQLVVDRGSTLPFMFWSLPCVSATCSIVLSVVHGIRRDTYGRSNTRPLHIHVCTVCLSR